MSAREAPRRSRPKRSLGQNFLVNDGVARKIAQAVGAGPDDEVLEIGPGRGALTRHLEGVARRLILVELDDALAGDLAKRYADRPDVVVVHGDALKVSWLEHVGEPSHLCVVGNIPYNVTTPLIFRLLERPRPSEIVLMVQREVAQRIVAEPGGRTYGALAVGVRSVAEAEILFGVSRRSFRPVPRVDSAVVRIRPAVPEPLDPEMEARLRHVVRALFQWRRKQLGKTLRDHPDLRVPPERLEAVAEAAGASLADRPERIAPEGFVRLAAALPQR